MGGDFGRNLFVMEMEKNMIADYVGVMQAGGSMGSLAVMMFIGWKLDRRLLKLEIFFETVLKGQKK